MSDASLGRYLPGLLLAGGLAALALSVASFLPPVISPILVAVILGLAVGNIFRLPDGAKPGLDVAAKRVLRLGVVLLGAKLSLSDVVGIGYLGLGVVAVGMIVAFTIVGLSSRFLDVPPRLGLLLAVGTAVCGNSAIVATAPVIGAEEDELGVALGTITIFGTVALLLFPVLAHSFGMSDSVFGFWAGLSINDTSQVVAAGAAYSPEALETATVVKLVRNTLMAPLILLIYWWTRRSRSDEVNSGTAMGAARDAFPLFVLGFLALAALRTLGVIDAELASALAQGSTVLIAVAIAAVGASVRVSRVRSIGSRPFMVGFVAAAGLSLVGVLLARAVG